MALIPYYKEQTQVYRVNETHMRLLKTKYYFIYNLTNEIKTRIRSTSNNLINMDHY